MTIPKYKTVNYDESKGNKEGPEIQNNVYFHKVKGKVESALYSQGNGKWMKTKKKKKSGGVMKGECHDFIFS